MALHLTTRSRGVLAALALLGVAAAEGCASNCLQVQQVLCLCKGKTQNERNTCSDNASAQQDLAPPTTDQLATCKNILPGCSAVIGDDGQGCDQLQTPAGARACGIAKPD